MIPSFDARPSAPAPATFPRIYRVRRGWRVFCSIPAWLLIGFGLLGAAHFAAGHEPQTLGEAMVFIGLSLALVGLGLHTVASMSRSRLRLDADNISVSGLIDTRSLRKAEIVGRRVRPGYRGSPATLMLVPARPDAKPLKIARMFATDAVFDAWLADIPDWDAADAARIARERQRSEAEIVANPALGRDTEERLARLRRARVISRVLNGLAPVVFLWCAFYPRPYTLAIAVVAVLPWLAIGLAAVPHSLFRLAEKPGDAHPNLVQILILPGLILLLRGVLDFHLVAWAPTLRLAMPVAGLLAAVLFAAAMAADRGLRSRRAAWGVVLPFLAAYAVGAVLLGNAVFDPGPPQTFATTVTGRHVSSGSRSITWYLRLAPWGPFPAAADVAVPRGLYEREANGRQVCATLHAGVLAVSWYGIGECPDALQTEQKMRALRQRAEAGDRVAENDLGAALYNGAGVPRDPVEAVQWFRRAADQGDPQARYNLGVAIQNGAGAPRDPAEAAHWYALSEAEYAPSAAALGYLYELGLGVPQDQAAARRHYESAALRGNLIAQENLATMYAYGRGGPIDHVQALRWNMAAARQGGLIGINDVGYAYLEGLGTDRDPVKGFAWLMAAAKAGQPNAMHTIGAMFLNGTGRPPDAAEAYRWLSLAIRAYPPNDERLPAARMQQDRAAADLSEQQRAEIDAAVAAWKSSPPQLPD
jgi:TPR repeat protein